MKTLLIATWLATGAYAPPDTLVQLRRGDRIVVHNLSGALVVEAWGRGEMDVGGEVEGLALARDGNLVRVVPGDPKARGLDVEAVLRVPEWVDVEVQGPSLDVTLSGLRGEVEVRNVSGDIRVSDVEGRVTLASQDGEITVRGARGAVTAVSRGDAVRLIDVVGAVAVESGSDDVRLENVEASSVRASTFDGDLFFDGSLTPGGTYVFSVHQGDAVLVLPRDAGARVSVATFDGEFTSDFPVVLQGAGGGGTLSFTLGSGGAEVKVQVFDGEIRLVQRGR